MKNRVHVFCCATDGENLKPVDGNNFSPRYSNYCPDAIMTSTFWTTMTGVEIIFFVPNCPLRNEG